MYIRMYFVIMKLQIFKSAYEMVRDILGGSGGEAPREKIRVFRWWKWIFLKKNGVWQPMSEKISLLIRGGVLFNLDPKIQKPPLIRGGVYLAGGFY